MSDPVTVPEPHQSHGAGGSHTPTDPQARPTPTDPQARPTPTVWARLGAAVLVLVAVVAPFLLILLAVELRWPPLEHLDTGVAHSLHTVAASHPALVTFLVWVQQVLHPDVLRVLGVALVVWLWLRRERLVALWVAVALTVGGVLGLVLKLVVRRARPVLDDPVSSAPGYSFPSGHALNSCLAVAVALVVLLPMVGLAWRWVLIVTGVALVLLVGFDRVGLGVHYVSDVVGGWVLALAVVAATLKAIPAALPRHRRARLSDSVPERRPLGEMSDA
ncbi:MAG: phosphatase PAP2 family protein [Actinomycetales bacterium]